MRNLDYATLVKEKMTTYLSKEVYVNYNCYNQECLICIKDSEEIFTYKLNLNHYSLEPWVTANIILYYYCEHLKGGEKMNFASICKDCNHKNVCNKKKECEILVEEIKREISYKFTFENGFDLAMKCKDYCGEIYSDEYDD